MSPPIQPSSAAPAHTKIGKRAISAMISVEPIDDERNRDDEAEDEEP